MIELLKSTVNPQTKMTIYIFYSHHNGKIKTGLINSFVYEHLEYVTHHI